RDGGLRRRDSRLAARRHGPRRLAADCRAAPAPGAWARRVPGDRAPGARLGCEAHAHRRRAHERGCAAVLEDARLHAGGRGEAVSLWAGGVRSADTREGDLMRWIVAVVLVAAGGVAAAQDRAWIEASDRYSNQLLETLGQF